MKHADKREWTTLIAKIVLTCRSFDKICVLTSPQLVHMLSLNLAMVETLPVLLKHALPSNWTTLWANNKLQKLWAKTRNQLGGFNKK